ncbi:MAG: YqaJ viral recombinase family protein, partial [Myxococcaceae bacterium]|nr:YqaJ viral recombinase family protein [Myxococcaceae bacterium]
LRRRGIGGSEIGAVAGLSPYATPLDVWRAKVEGTSVPETTAMRRGRLLEPAVAEWYAEETGASLRSVGTLQHPTRPIALATPDRLASLRGEDRVLEIKTSGLRAAERWGRPGTDEVPPHYLAQVAWEMAVTGLPQADLAVLIAGEDFRVYHFERDAELEGYLFELAERFWVDHVEARRPPALDGSEAARRWLHERYPVERGPVRAAGPEAERWADVLREATARAGAEDLRAEEAKNHLKALIGDAEGLVGRFGTVRWTRSRSSTRTDWEAVARSLGAGEELVRAHTTVVPGPRVFRPSWKE